MLCNKSFLMGLPKCDGDMQGEKVINPLSKPQITSTIHIRRQNKPYQDSAIMEEK
jgi:hypothetical protein